MCWNIANPLELVGLIERALRPACDDFNIPWAASALATRSSTGASVRLLWLRQVSPEARQLIHFCDRRSSKIQEIAAGPEVEWCFFHPQEKIQLRAAGSARFEHGTRAADEAWRSLDERRRRPWRAALAPGSLLPAVGEPPPLDEAAGQACFGLLVTEVVWWDWLHLDPGGARRARVSRDGSGWTGAWLAP